MQAGSVEDLIRSACEQIVVEVASEPYAEAELRMIGDDNFYYGRVLREETRAYAIESIVWNIARAIRYLELDGSRPDRRVVDLGAGLGMESIIFAALGAQVLAIDLNGAAIELAAKRASYFERLWSRPLRIEFQQGNFATMDLDSRDGQYNCLFSMSAFSHIPPLDGTVGRATRLLDGRGRAFVWDINPGWLYLRPLRPSQRHLPTPGEVRRSFARAGFVVDAVSGGTALPSMFWRSSALRPVAALVNRAARRWVGLSINFVLAARQAQHSTS